MPSPSPVSASRICYLPCLIGFLVLLLSCDDPTYCTETAEGTVCFDSEDLGGAGSEGGETILNPANLSYLNCAELDPDKVYLHGTLQPGSSGRDAIINPENPNVFCVGFSGSIEEGAISEAGAYIYADESTSGQAVFRTMTPDALQLSDDLESWEYPENTGDNDSEIFTANTSGCGVANITISPSDNEIFYTCPNNTVHSQTSISDYSLGNDTFLGLTPGGSMIIGGLSGTLKIVDANLVESPITIPNVDSGSPGFVTRSKLFVDPVSDNNSAWVYVENSLNPGLSRWSIDLVTLEATDDGEAAPFPESATEGFDLIIDGNGDLWQTGGDADSTADLIVMRPLVSSGASSEVIYTEENNTGGSWWTEAYPYVEIHISYLVTGE